MSVCPRSGKDVAHKTETCPHCARPIAANAAVPTIKGLPVAGQAPRPISTSAPAARDDLDTELEIHRSQGTVQIGGRIATEPREGL